MPQRLNQKRLTDSIKMLHTGRSLQCSPRDVLIDLFGLTVSNVIFISCKIRLKAAALFLEIKCITFCSKCITQDSLS